MLTLFLLIYEIFTSYIQYHLKIGLCNYLLLFFVLLLNFYVGSEGTSYWFIPRPLIRLCELKFNVENAVVDRPKDLFAF